MDAGHYQPPGIIELMINMFMKGGAPIKGKAEVLDAQEAWMKFCVFVALVCVPTMLLVEPIVHGCCQKHKTHEVEETELA